MTPLVDSLTMRKVIFSKGPGGFLVTEQYNGRTEATNLHSFEKGYKLMGELQSQGFSRIEETPKRIVYVRRMAPTAP